MNIRRIARRVAKKRISGDTLQLLKEFGISDITTKLEKAFFNLEKKTDSWEEADNILKEEVFEVFGKTFPDEQLNIPSSLADAGVTNWIHEVLHMVIDPDHDLANLQTSKSGVEGSIDEIILRIIEDPHRKKDGEDLVEEETRGELLAHAQEGFTLGQYLDALSAIPLENQNKARLFKDVLSYVKNLYGKFLNTPYEEEIEVLDEEYFGDTIPAGEAASQSIAMRLFDKARDYISYMPEEREAKYKMFVRLLDQRLNKFL